MSKTALLVLAVALVGCKSGSDAKPQASNAPLADLTKSLDTIRGEFNAHAREPRFVTLLSAT